MGILESTSFVVKEVHKSDVSTPKIVISFKPLDQEIILAGAVLEAQYSVGKNYVLFITEGNPYEEALYIYLLNESLAVLDSIELSADYTSAILKNLRVNSSSSICFSFFEDSENWLLEFVSKPKTILWANKFPIKRKSPYVHKAYMLLTKS